MKFLRVNISKKEINVEDVPVEYAQLGGRGLTSALVSAEVPPTCNALGRDNKLFFAPGLLSGTMLVNTSRLSIGAKSPLTGAIKESNAGGTIAASLGKLGITVVIVEGQAPEGELYILVIDKDGNAKLETATKYTGMRTYELTSSLFESLGEKNSILCIGPAGEYQLDSASIQSTDVDNHPCRAAGRGGLGAVMGSKGLKAIVVDSRGNCPDTLADPDDFKQAARSFAQIIKNNPFTGKILPSLGTAGLLAGVNSLGGFPSYNATKGEFDKWEKISGETLAQTIQDRGGKTTHMGCSQCIVRCSNEYVNKDGDYITSSLEYETIWAMGGMTGIDDMDTIARLDFLCDDLGLDTMNTGVAVAVAMDAGYAEFGDSQAALEMLEEIAQGTSFGKILGNGPDAVAEHLNHHRSPTVKHQSIAAYDPRALQGNGVTYATSPMGADHTAGNLIGKYLAGALDPLGTEGQIEASLTAQIAMAGLDCTGLCMLAGGVLADPEASKAMVTMIGAKLGTKPGSDILTKTGKAVLKTELEFNRKAGITKEDNRLAKFFYEEPLPPHNKVFLIENKDLDSIFNF